MEKPEPEKDNPAPRKDSWRREKSSDHFQAERSLSLRPWQTSPGGQATDPSGVSPRQKSSAQFPRALGPLLPEAHLQTWGGREDFCSGAP